MATQSFTALQSSHVATVSYDTQANRLTVQYKDGNAYSYHGVPSSTWMGLQGAKSVGSFIATQIKPVFKHKKIKTPK